SPLWWVTDDTEVRRKLRDEKSVNRARHNHVTLAYIYPPTMHVSVKPFVHVGSLCGLNKRCVQTARASFVGTATIREYTVHVRDPPLTLVVTFFFHALCC
ncbi:unnamed protein product, partial [Ectocarpus sp. 12 AP-2014]